MFRGILPELDILYLFGGNLPIFCKLEHFINLNNYSLSALCPKSS
jgi:hypothetical protein